jgi:hypothetical protein
MHFKQLYRKNNLNIRKDRAIHYVQIQMRNRGGNQMVHQRIYGSGTPRRRRDALQIMGIINSACCFNNTRWFYYYDIHWTDNGKASKIVLRHRFGDIISLVYRSTHNTQVDVFIVYETKDGKEMAEHIQKKTLRCWARNELYLASEEGRQNQLKGDRNILFFAGALVPSTAPFFLWTFWF